MLSGNAGKLYPGELYSSIDRGESLPTLLLLVAAELDATQGHHWGTGESRFSVGQLRVELQETHRTKDRSEATSIGT